MRQVATAALEELRATSEDAVVWDEFKVPCPCVRAALRVVASSLANRARANRQRRSTLRTLPPTASAISSSA